MSRSRLVLILAMSVVVLGVVAGTGAIWMSSGSLSHRKLPWKR